MSQPIEPTGLPGEPATTPSPGGVMPGIETDFDGSATAPLPLEYATGPRGKWTVGTLAYTTGGLIALFCVLLGGDFALSMRERAIPSTTAKMLKWYHASDLTFSLLTVSLPPVLSLLFVPLVSFRSDRHRGRWGRRIPYLLATTPVAAGCMAGLAFAGDIGHRLSALGHGRWSADACSLVCFGVLWTGFECAALTGLALFAALANDVVPRPLLGRFYGLFRAVSLFAGILFNYAIFPHADGHVHAILVSIAIVFAVGFTFMCLRVREGSYPPPVTLDGALPEGCVGRLVAVWLYLQQSFREPYYLRVFAALTLGGITFYPVNTFSYFYSQQVGQSDTTYGHLVALTYLISLGLALPMGWLVDRLSAVSVATCCIAAYAASMLFAGVTVHGSRSFGAALVVHGVVSGCYFTAAASMPQALLPRLRFGQFASAAGIVQAMATMAVGPITGQLLDWSGHNYRLTFYYASGLAAVGVVCLLAVGLSKRPADDDHPPAGFPVVPIAAAH